jgi:hypothetical protein
MADTPVLPSWRYHVSGQARIITTVEELRALEAGQWYESPAEAADAATKTDAETRREDSGVAASSRPRVPASPPSSRR